jgi:uroporphyrinogen decarboxylase
MNSRQRIQAAINHEIPDRVPLDLGSTIVTGIAATKYAELINHLGFNISAPRIYDVYLMLAQPDLELLNHLEVDTVQLPWLMRRDRWGIRLDQWKDWMHPRGTKFEVPANFNPVQAKDGSLLMQRDGAIFAKMPVDGHYFDYIESQRAVGTNLPDTEAARYSPLTDEELRFLETTSLELYRGTDKALIGDGGGQDLDIVGSYDEWLMLLAADPNYIQDFYAKRAESVIVNLEMYSQVVADRIEVIFFGQDFGMQDRPLLSPRSFEQIMVPPYKKIFDWIHTHTPWKVMFHSDGSLIKLLPMMLDMGIDILNPIQVTAKGMDPDRLKQEFGDRLVFWGGGVDSQTTLPHGTPDEVREQVLERMTILSPGGGYVFSPVHNILSDVPVENILSAYSTAREFGEYPIVKD